MERIYIETLLKEKPQKAKLTGWVHRINSLGQVNFVILRDKTGVIQLVMTKEQLENLKLETPITVIGKVVENPKAINNIEMQVEDLNLLGKVYDSLPFEINKKTIQAKLETQLDNRTIALRRPNIRAIFKIQQEIEEGFKTYLKSKNFSQIHTPKIIDSSTEGGSEMFTVDYYGRRSFLAQSPQFYKQMMVGAGFERVFEIGHAYRAELHNTWRHLSEYISLDVEMGFIENEEDIMKLEEDILNYIFSHLNKTCKKELDMFNITLEENFKIPRISLKEAQDILLEKFNKRSPIGNLDAEGEKIFSKYVKETYNSDFIFVTEYPISKRPVYTMPHESKKEVTRSFDLIYKGLEITTGGQRIHDYKMLIENIKKFDMKPENFEFYTDTFKYGMPPHGGFAIGLERLTMQILNLTNIREASLIPRDLKRIKP
ncbi:aspartyl-tRNA synthetase [Hypnocyclicus thermotrophus]|uniref:Aspartate--tRNA ligase n=1 Tax=Hypnocyclicus thermotrophus TaxID=1627895 RepID=A0AA46E049_9FUSO|nr:aspartate--tRNA(Asn) ligase [Hypnocyclicus thermotrophus]TDT72242.1 aspartyl-tRNA synthetase [Hypnocyclicus thermotrophus]